MPANVMYGQHSVGVYIKERRCSGRKKASPDGQTTHHHDQASVRTAPGPLNETRHAWLQQQISLVTALRTQAASGAKSSAKDKREEIRVVVVVVEVVEGGMLRPPVVGNRAPPYPAWQRA